MCRFRTQPPTCSSLSRQWARIDPENGAPWLFAAKADASGKPSATIDEVLFRLGSAQRVDGQFFSVVGEIVRHAGIGDSWVLAASLAIGVSAGRFMEPLQYLTQACRDAALNDANRRQLLEDATEALVSRPIHSLWHLSEPEWVADSVGIRRMQMNSAGYRLPKLSSTASVLFTKCLGDVLEVF